MVSLAGLEEFLLMKFRDHLIKVTKPIIREAKQTEPNEVDVAIWKCRQAELVMVLEESSTARS